MGNGGVLAEAKVQPGQQRCCGGGGVFNPAGRLGELNPQQPTETILVGNRGAGVVAMAERVLAIQPGAVNHAACPPWQKVGV